ncbi:hypothetical protein LOC71_04825 [Rhodopirellula sp. JC740]|uniref:Uncharacterized protein n=1 Tax=Rhodopirellula halodulae TaxID=2894198 RepID=A0ABS8NF82_9BACT|nr:hypothetical protein [Rhodopirellula sp. JC740]
MDSLSVVCLLENRHCQMHTVVNPYEFPGLPEDVGRFNKRGCKRGPALYLVAGAILSAICVAPLHALLALDAFNIVRFNNLFPVAAACAFVLFGMPVGGIVYRVRSRNWPIDPSVLSRQLWMATATLAFPLVTLAFTLPLAELPSNRDRAMLLAMFAFFLAASMAAGILLAGTRRPKSKNG